MIEYRVETEAEKDNLKTDPQTQALFEDAIPSVGNIIASHYYNGKQVMGSAGSGFFVKTENDKNSARCEMVTDNHVISLDKRLTVELEVQLHDGSKHKASIIKQDPAHDLAFLKIEDVADPQTTCKALTLSDRRLSPGESTIRLNRTRWEPGFRLGNYKGIELRKDQQLPELEGEDMNREFLVFDTFNSTGYQFSGGPYIDKSGKAVAIHEGGQSSDKSLATPASDIIEQLDQYHKIK